MTTNQQVRMLHEMRRKEKSLGAAAAKAGMCESTARKYVRLKKLPSQCKKDHIWRTRSDAFAEVWEEVKAILKETEGAIEAKALFEEVQRSHPGKFADGQVRTFQRRVKLWRALEGPGKEVFFAQDHHAGELSQSDFTDMRTLGMTVCGQPFAHLMYHFVLTYSNWETGTICYSESYESLAEGLQNALWELGGVPAVHQTDRLSAAVHNLSEKKEFTQRYSALLRHYSIEGHKGQAGKANENGDVEQRHHRFKRAVEQELLLRGGRDFLSVEELDAFYRKLFNRLNAGRRQRFEEERKLLRPLPGRRLEDYTPLKVRVSAGSTIRVHNNTYSVHSRLIDEHVTVRVYADRLEVWYAQKRIETLPRLRGDGKHFIQFRHIIDWLVRKPGAFAKYRYRADLFPSSYFRMAYDNLKAHTPRWSDRQYLKILQLAASESQERTEAAIRCLVEEGVDITFDRVEALVGSDEAFQELKEVHVDEVDLSVYDKLLEAEEVG
jgi:hypothetical protein